MKKFTILLLLFPALESYGQSIHELYPSIQGELIERTYFSLDYNESTEQANWVIYAIHPFGETKRKDRFKEDPLVSTRSATLKDYQKSGYDRGHLAPAGDMVNSKNAMEESFFMSNMSPQKPGFNRGIWKSLEDLMRSWAKIFNSGQDYVVVGPVIGEANCGTIGDGVIVPCHYYRIYVDLETEVAIGFILPNESGSDQLHTYSVSIDSIEAITGIDFFPLLNDSLENKIERMQRPDLFLFNIENLEAVIENMPPLKVCSSPTSGDSICTRKTRSSNGFCYDHQHLDAMEPRDSLENRCKALTANGTRCKRSAQEGGFCWQHE